MRAAKAAIGTHLHASADVYFGVAPKEANRRTVTISFAAAAMRPVAPLGVECNKAASESHAHPIRTPLNSSWSKD